MNEEFYQHPKSSLLMRIFWKAAGADRFILERSTYGDQIKYLCLGGIIAATGFMSGISGGYAFYMIFEPKGNAIDSFRTTSNIQGYYESTDIKTAVLSTIFGIFWGLMIFNLDRFIISSTGKGDGTEAITKSEIKGALPRLLMGAIIAMTISQPVEIRMFKTEIDVKLHEKQMEQQQQYKAKTDSLFNEELTKKDVEIKKVENDLEEKKTRFANLQAQYIAEARIITVGPRAQAIKAQMDDLAAEINALKLDPDYIRVRHEKDEIENRRQLKLAESEKQAAGLDGLLERIIISHEAAGWEISLFITLLFLAIELTPIFFKLMLIKSPYDYLEENIKELIKAQHGVEVQYNYYQDKEGHERDKVVHHEVLRLLREKVKLLETQTELSVTAIESWKQEKLSGIQQNPSSFITENPK